MPTATRFPAGQRGGGRAVGIRHLNHSLSPPTPPQAKRGGGVLPIQGLGGWRVQNSPGPLRSTAPSPLLGKCISYSVCNAGPSPGDWGALGWPPMPWGGGRAGGHLHRDVSQTGPARTGLHQRLSPRRALGWGGWGAETSTTAGHS